MGGVEAMRGGGGLPVYEWDAVTGDLQTGKGHPRAVGWFSVHAQYCVGFLDRIPQNHYW